MHTRREIEQAWALVPQDPDFSHLQALSTPILDCLQESLRSMGDTDPLRTVILGIICTRENEQEVELIDMFGNRSRVDPRSGRPFGGYPLEHNDARDSMMRARASETSAKKRACWKGYTKVGTKMKNGREVPNCVPNKKKKIREEETATSVRTSTLDATSVLDDALFGSMRAPRNPLLDEAIRRDAVRADVPLFRGLEASELVDQGDMFQAHGYLLMTENPSVAIGHADAVGTGEVLVVRGAVALQFWTWLRRVRAKLLLAGADEMDVDARIARAERERSWVALPRTRFTIERTGEGSGLFAGRRVVRAKPMDESNTLAELLEGVRAEERASMETATDYKGMTPSALHKTLTSQGYAENKGKRRTMGGTGKVGKSTGSIRQYSHPTQGKLQVRFDHHGSNPSKPPQAKVAHVKSLASAETAAGFAEIDPREHRDDLLLSGGSDVVQRYDSMMIRRRSAALCHQPREAQRLDRKINILRAALGMTPLPPIDVIQSGRAFDQGREVLAERPLDPFNREWMQQQTASCVKSWCDRMQRRGFALARRHVDANTVAWCATGSEQLAGTSKYELHVLGGAWCTAAYRNGELLPLFDAAPSGDAALRSMASDAWNGSITGEQAQNYCKSWSRLNTSKF